MSLKESIQEGVEEKDGKFIKTNIKGFGESEIIIDSRGVVHIETPYKKLTTDDEKKEAVDNMEKKFDYIEDIELIVKSSTEDKLVFRAEEFKW